LTGDSGKIEYPATHMGDRIVVALSTRKCNRTF
jgi:putative transposon-encoded protein